MKELALITGAAKNIGKGIANTLFLDGYDCILVDKDEEALKKVSTDFKEKFPDSNCYEYIADISNPAELEGMTSWINYNGYKITALINNAAYESENIVTNLNYEEITKTNSTNISGPFYLTSLIVRDWIDRKTKGRIVFISSTHSKIIRTHPLYSASKAAIEMFVTEAGLELAEYGIRVNAVAPGPTQDTEELKIDTRVPLGYYQQPKDIGEAVVFLLSEKSRFITGQSIVVDGGYSLAHTHHWLKNGKFVR